jgi:uncharacterized membrane protein
MSNIPPPTVPPATPPPPPPPGTAGAGSDRTLMIILAYLGVLALIPYITKKEDPEVHWHAKNGLGLLILDVVLIVVLVMLGFLVGNVPGLGCAVSVINCVLPIAILGLHIFCMVQAVGGQRPRIPGITDFAEKTF